LHCSLPVLPPHLLVHVHLFDATPPTEIYTLSLHDALPILDGMLGECGRDRGKTTGDDEGDFLQLHVPYSSVANALDYRKLEHFRSEEHTSELQSRENLVCRLLLEKKKQNLKGAAKHLSHH